MTKRRKVEPHWLQGTAFKLSIQCNNAAFRDSNFEEQHIDATRAEISRILREVANKIEHGVDFGMYQTIFDVNGNDVGRYALKDIASDGSENFPQILR